MPGPLLLPPPPAPDCTGCAGTLVAAASLAWAATPVADNRDQPSLEAERYPLRPCDLQGALSSLSARKAVGSQLPVPPG